MLILQAEWKNTSQKKKDKEKDNLRDGMEIFSLASNS